MSRLQRHNWIRPTGPFPAGHGLALLAAASAAALLWQMLRPAPVEFAGLVIDRLSALMGLFVALVGCVVHRFACRSMEGHPERSRFLMLLALAVMIAFTLSLSGHLLLLMVMWSLLGAVVHPLLRFGDGSAAAARVARRESVAARVGEVTLLIAGITLWWTCGTADIGACVAQASSMDPVIRTVVGLLLAVAAMSRAVQVPFHAWLPDSMHVPTPVSALLHAGIVNAGGILLLRFAPILVRVPEACLLLSIVGTLTVIIGSLAMSQQVRLKQGLAWSTVAQMGFMVVQCAVAAFPAALLHLVGHGACKALAFLRSGASPAATRPAGTAAMHLTLLVLGTASAMPSMWLAEWWTGFSPWHTPGETALAAIVALAVGQTWMLAWAAVTRTIRAVVQGVGISVLASLAVPQLCFGLYRGAGMFLAPVLGELPAPSGPLATLAAALPAAAITLLVLAHALQPWLVRWSRWRSLLVQARAGFHLGRLTDRALMSLPNSNTRSEIQHA